MDLHVYFYPDGAVKHPFKLKNDSCWTTNQLLGLAPQCPHGAWCMSDLTRSDYTRPASLARMGWLDPLAKTHFSQGPDPIWGWLILNIMDHGARPGRLE